MCKRWLCRRLASPISARVRRVRSADRASGKKQIVEAAHDKFFGLAEPDRTEPVLVRTSMIKRPRIRRLQEALNPRPDNRPGIYGERG